MLTTVGGSQLEGPTESGAVACAPPAPRGYAAGSILPSGDAASRDAALLEFYTAWKKRYLVAGCTPGRIYASIAADGSRGGGGKVEDSITVSELHGFAMVIVAAMANLDPDAHRLFDGLYAYFRDNPSERSADLMAWNQIVGCLPSPEGTSSATDGDLDIAHALLIADQRFGSAGAVNYRAAALRVIEAIRAEEMDPLTHLTLLGDFATPGVGRHGESTRTSDFMIDHFRGFAAVTADGFWSSAVDAHWDLVLRLQDRFAPATGLLPDFVIHTRTDPEPPPGTWLETENDPNYGWNACRVPWRLGTDYLVSGDPRGHAALTRLNTWVRASTGDDPSKIDNGYRLDGRGITPFIRNESAFLAPFGVAAMIDVSNQAWLDRIWELVRAIPIGEDNYYGNSIKMLSMIVMSGRWPVPQ